MFGLAFTGVVRPPIGTIRLRCETPYDWFEPVSNELEPFAINQVGADRLLFATDYPFEDLADGATRFDQVRISETNRLKIGRANAQQLFGL